MFKIIPMEIKEEILRKVKQGEIVIELSKQYGLDKKTIYNWISKSVKPEGNILEINHLKRENEELKRIIGMITLDLERGKKGRVR